MIKYLFNRLFSNVPVKFPSAFPMLESLSRLQACTEKNTLSSFFREKVLGTVKECRVQLQRARPFFDSIFKPVFIGRFRYEHGVTVLEGRFTMLLSTKIFYTLWLTLVFLAPAIVSVIALNDPSLEEDFTAGIVACLLFSLVGVAFGLFGIASMRFGWWLSRKDIPYLTAVIENALGAAVSQHGVERAPVDAGVTFAKPTHIVKREDHKRFKLKDLTSYLDRLETISQAKFLLINAGIGGVVLLAHGGALLFVLRGHSSVTPEFQALARNVVPFSLPIAALMILSSAAGRVWEAIQSRILRYHGAVLFPSSLVLLAWAISILINGIPEGGFSWSPGLLTVSMVYSTFLFARFTMRAEYADQSRRRRMTLIAFLTTLPIDLGVFALLILKIAIKLGKLPDFQ